MRERNNFERRLAENPSLKAKLPVLLAAAYEDGRRETIAEMGLAADVFSERPDITLGQVWDRNYWQRYVYARVVGRQVRQGERGGKLERKVG